MSLGTDSLQPGSPFGKYVIEGLLGEGGAARVYRARHATLGTTHAIKVLTQASRGMKERLMLEGRVQASLQHPNIVRVLDVDSFDGMPCLVMEFIDGPTLADVLRLKTPTIESADQLGRQLLDAVAYAHDQGLVHRDLKPENILLAHQGRRIVPKIADFGLVKVMGSELSRTRTGSTMGTPLYMSPEQVRDAKNVDHRSDIFSVGTILYTLLAGANPFDSNDMFEVFQAIVEGRCRPLRDVRPELPERMLRSVEKAMELDPDDRFATAGDMLDCWSAEPIQKSDWEDEFYDTARKLAGSTGSTLTTTGDDAPTTFPEGDSRTAKADLLAPGVGLGAPTLQETLTDEVRKAGGAPWLALAGVAGAVGALGLVALGLFLATLRDPVPTTAPVPIEAPAPVAQPVEPPAPTPASEPRPDPAPEPERIRPSPAPAPVPVRQPVPAEPEPVAPALPEPVPAVPAPTVPSTRFVNANPSVRVILRGDAGDRPPGALPPGTYTVIAFFDGSPTRAGSVTVADGQTVHVDCKPMLRLCSTR